MENTEGESGNLWRFLSVCQRLPGGTPGTEINFEYLWQYCLQKNCAHCQSNRSQFLWDPHLCFWSNKCSYWILMFNQLHTVRAFCLFVYVCCSTFGLKLGLFQGSAITAITQPNRVSICIHCSNAAIMQMKRGSRPAPVAHLMSFIRVCFTTAHKLMPINKEPPIFLFVLVMNLFVSFKIHWSDGHFIKCKYKKIVGLYLTLPEKCFQWLFRLNKAKHKHI